MTNPSPFRYFLAAGAIVLGVTACGGGDDSGNTGGNLNMGGSGGSGGSTGGGMTFDDCMGDTPYFDGTAMECIDQATAVQRCKDGALEQQPGTNVSDPTCGAGCTCTNCTQEMLDCGSDPDQYCTEIVKCANEKNCTGVACYAADTCQAVIDAAPGGGLSSGSVAYATALSDCVAPMGGAQICAPACL